VENGWGYLSETVWKLAGSLIKELREKPGASGQGPGPGSGVGGGVGDCRKIEEVG